MATASTIAEAERVNQRMVEADAKYKDPVVVGSVDNNTRYAAHLYKNSAEIDTKVALTKTLKDQGYGSVVITDRLVDYFYDKAQDEEFGKREKWIAENFDLSNPIVKTFLDKVAPGFSQRREAYAIQKLRDQEKLIRLAFHGPQSEDDLDFMYHIATGRISVEELERPPWLQREDAASLDNDNYIQGLFSPRRWTGREANDLQILATQGGVPSWGTQSAPYPTFTQARDGTPYSTTGFNGLGNPSRWGANLSRNNGLQPRYPELDRRDGMN